MMRGLGLVDSEMYGGYSTEETHGLAVAIPIRVDEQPSIPAGKYTTAADLGRLLQYVYLAAGGRGPLHLTYGGAFSPAEARYLIYLLVHVADSGKLGRYLRGSTTLAHKAGWIATARHDNGIVSLAGRRVRCRRDDLQPARRRHELGRARRPGGALQPRSLSRLCASG